MKDRLRNTGCPEAISRALLSHTQPSIAANYGPGYDVADSVNERSVKIIARKVLNNPNAQREGDYVFVEEGDRIRVVYFKEA